MKVSVTKRKGKGMSSPSLTEIKELPSKWLDQFQSMEADPSLRPKFDLVCRRLAFARRALDMLVQLEGDLPGRFLLLQQDIENISAASYSHGSRSDSLLPMVTSLLRDLDKVNGLLSLQASAFSDAYPYHRDATLNPTFHIRHDPFAEVYRDRDPYLDTCASADFLQLFEDLDHRGKYFLLCFAVFPADTVVDKRTLAFWCMGMGVLHPSENLLDRVSDRILEDLVVKGFVEAEMRNFKFVGFKLCPLVRCFIVKVAERFGFYTFDNEGAPSFDAAESSKVFLSRVGTTSSLDMLLVRDERLQKVECVLNVNEPFPDFDLQQFEKMKNLTALCLGRSSADQHIEIQSLDFLKGLKVVKKLTVLSLRGISQVVWLPDALCRNANLRVLDLNSCHNLEVLPEEIGSLVNLTHLDISKCYLLERMPKGLASLTKLRVLKGFLVVEDEVSCAFASLAGLKKLNKLSIYLNKIDFPSDDEQRVLRDFLLLRDFAIHWGGRAGTRKRHQLSKVDEPGTVLEEVIIDGLEGRGSCSAVPFDSEIGSEDQTGGISPSRNEDLVTNTTDILEGVRDTAAEVPDDVRVTIEDRNADESLSKGLGEPKAATTSKTLMKRVLSRIPTLLIKKDLATEPGAMLEAVDKLVLQCFPLEEVPSWLVPSNVPRLKELHIKGGKLRGFGNAWRDGASKLEMLRLNYLNEFELDEKDLRTYFPKLNRLAKVECPKLSGFPADDRNIRIPLRGGS